MTIEELKDRQEDLNNRLLNLLDEQRTVINKITGSNFSPTENPLETSAGLIAGISYEQERAKGLISELKELSQKLIEHTYQPTEAIDIAYQRA